MRRDSRPRVRLRGVLSHGRAIDSQTLAPPRREFRDLPDRTRGSGIAQPAGRRSARWCSSNPRLVRLETALCLWIFRRKQRSQVGLGWIFECVWGSISELHVLFSIGPSVLPMGGQRCIGFHCFYNLKLQGRSGRGSIVLGIAPFFTGAGAYIWQLECQSLAASVSCSDCGRYAGARIQ